MKKNNLLKVLTISFLIFVVLSWIIPAGMYANGTFSSSETAPIGLLDLASMPISTFTNFCGYGILILIIGGFYGVLEATCVFKSMVSKLSHSFDKKKKTFMVMTIIVFALLSSLTGSSYVLLILVPLFAAVLLELGYDKISSFTATIGSILVGSMASTYGFNVNGYINYYMGINDMNNQIVTKIILLVLLTLLLIFFVLRHTKKVEAKAKTVEKKEPVKVVETKTTKPEKKKTKGATKTSSTKKKTTARKTTTRKTNSKRKTANFAKADDVRVIPNKKEKSVWPFVIVFTLMIIFLLVACYNWRYSFNVSLFEEMYESITTFTIKDYPIFNNLIGTFNPLGYWAVNEVCMVLLIITFLIGWVYSVKLNDIVDAFGQGAKKALKPAFYVVMANLFMTVLLSNQDTGSMYFTISNYILEMTEDFNVFTAGIVSFIGGFFFNDMPYLISSLSSAFTTKITDSTLYPLIGLVMQSFHGLAMLLLPSSAILLGGLAYFDVSYKEWFKYIWKYLVQILVVALIVCVIVVLFI